MLHELLYSNGAVSMKFFRTSFPSRGGKNIVSLSFLLTTCPPVVAGMN